MARIRYEEVKFFKSLIHKLQGAIKNVPKKHLKDISSSTNINYNHTVTSEIKDSPFIMDFKGYGVDNNDKD